MKVQMKSLSAIMLATLLGLGLARRRSPAHDHRSEDGVQVLDCRSHRSFLLPV